MSWQVVPGLKKLKELTPGISGSMDRSACVKSTPVSTTATPTPAPVQFVRPGAAPMRCTPDGTICEFGGADGVVTCARLEYADWPFTLNARTRYVYVVPG